jgi:hypothetical protein
MPKFHFLKVMLLNTYGHVSAGIYLGLYGCSSTRAPETQRTRSKILYVPRITKLPDIDPENLSQVMVPLNLSKLEELEIFAKRSSWEPFLVHETLRVNAHNLRHISWRGKRVFEQLKFFHLRLELYQLESLFVQENPMTEIFVTDSDIWKYVISVSSPLTGVTKLVISYDSNSLHYEVDKPTLSGHFIQPFKNVQVLTILGIRIRDARRILCPLPAAFCPSKLDNELATPHILHAFEQRLNSHLGLEVIRSLITIPLFSWIHAEVLADAT